MPHRSCWRGLPSPFYYIGKIEKLLKSFYPPSLAGPVISKGLGGSKEVALFSRAKGEKEMFLTEAEASKKICPFDRNNEGDGYCAESLCMAWRISPRWDEGFKKQVLKGYCGLAGKPQIDPPKAED